MGWLALGAHISSKCRGCPSAHPAAAAANRSCVLWAAVASTSCRALCQVAMLFGVRWVPRGYRWDRGAWYILHLFRRSVVGLVPTWWGPR